MTEVSGRTGNHRGTATAVVHESYSFACMHCGHGWEQSYEIEHHTDAEGRDFVLYVVDGAVVPSPLSRPGCLRCEGHVVRIMRAGQVSSAQHGLPRQTRPVPRRTAEAAVVAVVAVAVADGTCPGDAPPADAPPADASRPARGRHRQLSGLLHLFRHSFRHPFRHSFRHPFRHSFRRRTTG